MWADNETSEDLLGFKVHAELLIDVINDETILPVTIGVFGDWGSGKSSILQIIKQKFEEKEEGSNDFKDKETLCIYFNGWTFEGYDDAKAALLNAILKELEDNQKLSSEIKKTVKEKAKKLWKSIDWMRAAGMVMKNIAIPAVTAHLTSGLSLLPFAFQKLSEFKIDTREKLIAKLTSDESEEFFKSLQKEEKEEHKTNAVADFRADFEDLLNATQFKKLVVIIDDLDRCTPERIIENLEAVKLFLNVPKTAFIIGADPRIVRHAIEIKYKTDKIAYSDDEKSKNERIVSDYLEKLIQIPYNLPKLSDYEVETYLTLLFCKRELKNKFSDILKLYQAHTATNRHSIFGFGNIENILDEGEKPKISESISLLASSSKIITDGLKGNPRQIKRFLNTFTLRKRLIDIAKFTDLKMDILAKLMVLEYSNIDLFRELYMWQSKAISKGEPSEIKELELLANESNKEGIAKKFAINWSKDEIITWLNSEPKLTGIDLRDYYWVSRDQLSDSISASSMISKEIRDLRNKVLEYSSDKELIKTIKDKVIKLQESDLKTLLGLFEKELIKNPSAEKLHFIFIQLMSEKVLFSVEIYVKILKQIDTKNIPGHLSSHFKIALTKNDAIQSAINELLKNDKSKISTSLKVK